MNNSYESKNKSRRKFIRDASTIALVAPLSLGLSSEVLGNSNQQSTSCELPPQLTQYRVGSGFNWQLASNQNRTLLILNYNCGTAQKASSSANAISAQSSSHDGHRDLVIIDGILMELPHDVIVWLVESGAAVVVGSLPLHFFEDLWDDVNCPDPYNPNCGKL